MVLTSLTGAAGAALSLPTAVSQSSNVAEFLDFSPSMRISDGATQSTFSTVGGDILHVIGTYLATARSIGIVIANASGNVPSMSWSEAFDVCLPGGGTIVSVRMFCCLRQAATNPATLCNRLAPAGHLFASPMPLTCS